MSTKLLTLLAVTALTAAACVQPLENQSATNTNTSSDSAIEKDTNSMVKEDDTAQGNQADTIMEEEKQGEAMVEEEKSAISDVQWSSFENRAVAYQIRHPQNWYWRHYIEPEISSDTVFNYFVVDPTTPPSFANDILGAVVVAASVEDVENILTDTKSKLARIVEGSTIIEGITAPRIQGTIREGDMQGTTIAMYVFNRRGVTYTFTFTKQDPTQQEIEIFEEMVRSFRFN